MRPRPSCWALVLVLAAALPAPAAEEPDVVAGLRWLAGQQSRDGSWGTDNQLAITGMAGLALLASGSTPRQGPFADHLTRAIEFVLGCQRQGDGKAFTHASSGYSAIHNHGYALLFLTQCYGMAGPDLDLRLHQAIEQGVKASVASQRDNGGFSYFLYDRVDPRHDEMWRWDEASTTISQIQALRGARNAGFTVERQALERAGDYVAASRHGPSGGFVYSIGGPNPPRVSFIEGDDRPTFAITAAATAVLHALGRYEGPIVEAGVAYMEDYLPPTRKAVHFYYYAHYYAAQVMHMLGGPRGRRWLEAARADLARRQRSDGRWPADPEDTLKSGDSELLNSAWALQVCLLHRSALPLHER